MNTKLSASIVVADYEGPGDFPAVFSKALSQITNMTGGTGSGSLNRVFSDIRSLAGAADEDLDLAGGVETPFGEALTFTKIKAILIIADDDNPDSIEVGPASSNGFVGPFADASDRLELDAGCCAMLIHPTTGWTVTAATGDLLNVLNNDATTTASYSIMIVGEGTVA